MRWCRIISWFQASALWIKGCEGFLAHVVNTEPSSSNIDNISIVHDFVNGYPQKLPGIVSDQEVEFPVELVPGISPISIALIGWHQQSC